MSGAALNAANAPIIPPRVRPGQTIGVIAPSGPPLAAPLQRGLDALASEFRVQVAPSALAPTPPPQAPYLAATDAARADELNAMLADPQVRAIVMARGGYGLMRILPALDPALLRADPKPLVGYSDGTALLSWAWAAGVRGVHGQVVVRLGPDRPEAAGDLCRALTDPTPLGRLPWPLTAARAPAAASVVEGPMFPANLMMSSQLVGTPWALPLRDATWWIEEVGERPYAIDRCLSHLGLAGALREVRGVVVGDLVHCTEPPASAGAPDDPGAALAVVLERLRHHGLPARPTAPFGHGRFNPPLPFGARCRLDLEAATAEILDGAVA